MTTWNLQERWAAEQLPLFTGIFHADGRVIPLHIRNCWDDDPPAIITTLPATTIDQLGIAAHSVTHIAECYGAEDPGRDLLVQAGGTSYGSEGYIVLCDARIAG